MTKKKVIMQCNDCIFQGMTCGGCAASVKRILESQVSFCFFELNTEKKALFYGFCLLLSCGFDRCLIIVVICVWGQQPQVSSASVNLTTETAIVWPIAEAKSVPNWQKELGEELAKHLTNCGFKSNLRG